MSPVKNGVWVTVIRNDTELAGVLSVARDLKARGSQRQTCVVVDKAVSWDARKELDKAFDAVLFPDWPQHDGALPDKDFLEIACLSIPFATEGVYINPGLEVLENPDTWFDSGEYGALWHEEEILLAKFKPDFGEIYKILSGNGKGEGIFSSLMFKDGTMECKNGGPLRLIWKGITTLVASKTGKSESLRGKMEILKYPLLSTLSNKVAEPIAVVGMACRFAKANGLDEYWNLLLNKQSGVQKVPECRWKPEHLPFIFNWAQFREVEGAFLDHAVEEGDPQFFGMSPFEFEFADPQQRLLLEVAWEALEDAAIDPHKLRGTRTGVFTGTWTTEYKDIMCTSSDDRLDNMYRVYMGTGSGPTSGRLSHFFGLTGPNVATESACSSSLVCVGMAVNSLRNGTSDAALACGANLNLIPYLPSDIEPILAPDGRCKSFDAKADGFGRGEGCGVLVLKRLSDAVQNKDRIHGLILGYGDAQEGTSSSMGTPTPEVETEALNRALADANVKADKVSYVEAHATGTTVGDAVEFQALRRVHKGRKAPLLVGTSKPNIGHTESCSGVAGIIKVLLMMRHGKIPGQIGCTDVNPALQLEKIPAEIAFDTMEWSKVDGQPRIAGVSSFGITGTDAHVILSDGPILQRVTAQPDDDTTWNVVSFSAKSEESLNKLLRKHEDFLKRTNTVSLNDYAFTMNAGRAKLLPYRAAIPAKGIDDLKSKLADGLISKAECSKVPKVCMVFPGNGCQYPGMGKRLYERFSVVKEALDSCFQLLPDYPLKDAIWGNKPQLLLNPAIGQLSIFCTEYAIFKLWESWGVKPDIVLGHSFGEYAASVAVGVLSLEDALEIVVFRNGNVSGTQKGAMTSVMAGGDKVAKLIKRMEQEVAGSWVDVSCYNTTDQTVVGSLPENIEAFEKICTSEGIKFKRLFTERAYHTRMTAPIIPSMREMVNKIPYLHQQCTYISSTTGDILEKGDICGDYWIKHFAQPVQFVKACETLQSLEPTICIEVSANPVVAGLVASNIRVKTVGSLRKGKDDVESVLTALSDVFASGVNVDWEGYHANTPGQKMSLPSYPFIRKPYWIRFNSTPRPDSNVIYSLLGGELCIPPPQRVFRSHLSLKNEGYLKDHVVGGYLLYPGAAFLEMFLGAGRIANYNAHEGHNICGDPITVKDFVVQKPLFLRDLEDIYELQTVVLPDKEEEDGNRATIFRKQGRWCAHSSATICFTAERLEEADMDLKLFKEQNGADWIDTGDFYKKLDQAGLNFGPTFRSVKRVQATKDGLLGDISVPEKNTGYVCHPLIIDAMIQVLVIAKNFDQKELDEKRLVLPVSVKSFTWFGHQDLPEFVTAAEGVATLMSCSGKPLAVMHGLETVETTLKDLKKVFEQESLQLPLMFVQKLIAGEASSPESLLQLSSTVFENLPAHDQESFTELENASKRLTMSALPVIANALVSLGWNFPVGATVDVENFSKSANIPENNKLLLRNMLAYFSDMGYLEELGSFKFIVKKPLPSKKAGKDNVETFPPEFLSAKILLDGCLNRLAPVLRGEDTVLHVLFPASGENLAQEVYSQLTDANKTDEAFNTVLDSVLFGKHVEQKLKILEIGAGTGSATVPIVKRLEELGQDYIYVYTDISPAFFIKAQQRFAEVFDKMDYRVLNVEEDPIGQGYCPFEYDFIIASNIFHATRSIKETLTNAALLLKPGGILLFVEAFKHPLLDFTFGLLDGWWRFKDTELRELYPLLTPEVWVRELANVGFENVSVRLGKGEKAGVFAASKIRDPVQYVANGSPKVWALFGNNCGDIKAELEMLGREVITVGYSERKSAERKDKDISVNSEAETTALMRDLSMQRVEGIAFLWGLEEEKVAKPHFLSQGFLNLVKALLCSKWIHGIPKIMLVTKGCATLDVGNDCLANPASACLWGMAKTVRNEHSNVQIRCVDVDVEEEEYHKQLMNEFWKNDSELHVAIRGKQRLCMRISPFPQKQEELDIPEFKRYQLILPESRVIQDLRFGPSSKLELSANGLEVAVKAAGLNFKDVLNVLKPDEQFAKANSLGADYCGVVTRVGSGVTRWRVGDEVIGVNFEERPLPSHVRTLDSMVLNLPKRLSFEQGATLPAVFATAYHCLIEIANLQKGETFLVHAASGGVGICAIQIAKQIGARVIATAGSKSKRAFLQQIMGIQDVFHSRDISFAENVMRATKNEGVHVVLNSLTGPGFKESSISCLRKGGRFVEMGKLNVWMPEEVESLRPDVAYALIDLTAIKGEDWIRLLEILDKWLVSGWIEPIPYTRFKYGSIREALSFLQQAKHIGKVVVVPGEERRDPSASSVEYPLFNKRGSYLITGGLGGIGIEVAQWVLEKGGEALILMGRNPPSKPVQEKIQSLTLKGARIEVLLGDVGSMDDCKKALSCTETADGLPPLRGIIHVAGTLSDGLIEEQTTETFKNCYRAKVDGAWNLHVLTLNKKLEHFILFSSMTAIFGNVKQANHVAANSFMDGLAHYRRGLGLPALSVNWGQWGEVGVAAKIQHQGMVPFTPSQAFASLELALWERTIQVGVVEGDISHIRRMHPWLDLFLSRYYPDNNNTVKLGMRTLNVTSESFWKEYNCKKGDKPGQVGVVESMLSEVVSFILRLGKEEKVALNVPLKDVGLDSLMMIEMRNILQDILGKSLTISSSHLADCNTLELLAARLRDIIEGDFTEKEDSFEDLIACDLEPLDISKLMKKSSACPIEEIRTVLLIGCTGHLGSHLLRKLLEKENISKVYCLVKAETMSEAEAKVLSKGSNFSSAKVEIILGDVTKKCFGIPETEYNLLAREVDAVFNAASSTSRMDKYTKSSMSRLVNVYGTKNVIHFTVAERTKHLFHATTAIYMMALFGENGIVDEDWPVPENAANLLKTMGQGFSNYAGDCLVGCAAKQGLPVKAFRFTYLAGPPVYRNPITLKTLAYIKTKSIPDIPTPLNVIPVEKAADMSLSMFLKKEAPSGMYNIVNPRLEWEQDLVEVAKSLGHQVDVVEFELFAERLDAEVGAEMAEFRPYLEMYKAYNKRMDTFAVLQKSKDGNFFGKVCQKASKYIERYGELCGKPSETIKRDLEFVLSNRKM